MMYYDNDVLYRIRDTVRCRDDKKLKEMISVRSTVTMKRFLMLCD